MSINNVVSDRNMGEKNESELKSSQDFIPGILKIIRMERAFDALDRRLEGNARHPEDEGWFD